MSPSGSSPPWLGCCEYGNPVETRKKPIVQQNLDESTRLRLWQKLLATIEHYDAQLPGSPVTVQQPLAELADLLSPLDFSQPLAPSDALDRVAKGLRQFQVHTPHPRYYGLF